jgi:CBS domain-containing protein
VVALICLHRISGVPVVDGRGNLVGLVSERDLVVAMYPDRPELRRGRHRSARLPSRSLRDIGEVPAQEIMVRDLVTGAPEADPLHLASLMALHKIRRIPIVEGRKLVGIVSLGDVYRAIFEMRRGRTVEDQEGAGNKQGTLREGRSP